MGSLLANAQVIVPFGHASLEVADVDHPRRDCDIILLGKVRLSTAPPPKPTWPFLPDFFLPTGEYDGNPSLNMGTNRWGFREAINFTKGFDVIPNHPIYFEVTAGTDFFTTNDITWGGRIWRRTRFITSKVT